MESETANLMSCTPLSYFKCLFLKKTSNSTECEKSCSISLNQHQQS